METESTSMLGLLGPIYCPELLAFASCHIILFVQVIIIPV